MVVVCSVDIPYRTIIRFKKSNGRSFLLLPALLLLNTNKVSRPIFALLLFYIIYSFYSLPLLLPFRPRDMMRSCRNPWDTQKVCTSNGTTPMLSCLTPILSCLNRSTDSASRLLSETVVATNHKVLLLYYILSARCAQMLKYFPTSTLLYIIVLFYGVSGWTTKLKVDLRGTYIGYR